MANNSDRVGHPLYWRLILLGIEEQKKEETKKTAHPSRTEGWATLEVPRSLGF